MKRVRKKRPTSWLAMCRNSQNPINLTTKAELYIRESHAADLRTTSTK